MPFAIAFFIRVYNSLIQVIFLLFISKVLTLTQFGIYSGFIIFLGYFTQIGRFSIMSHLLRKISTSNKSNQIKILYQNWLFFLITIPIACLISLPLFKLGFISNNFFVYFILLVFLTCFSTQLENFAMGTRRPLISTLNITLRNLWMPVLIIFKLVFKNEINLDIIFRLMISSEIISISFNLIMNQYIGLNPKKIYPFDIKLFKESIKIGFVHTIINVSSLLFVSNQRIFLELFSQSSDVGIFQFYFFICTGIPNLLEATLYSFLLPNLIVKNQPKQNQIIKSSFKEKFYLLSFSSLFLLITYYLIDFIILFTGKSELLDFKNNYLFIAIYALLHINFRIKFMNLYSANRDYTLLMVQLINTSFSILVSFLLVRNFNILGASISLVIAGLFENFMINLNLNQLKLKKEFI